MLILMSKLPSRLNGSKDKAFAPISIAIAKTSSRMMAPPLTSSLPKKSMSSEASNFKSNPCEWMSKSTLPFNSKVSASTMAPPRLMRKVSGSMVPFTRPRTSPVRLSMSSRLTTWLAEVVLISSCARPCISITPAIPKLPARSKTPTRPASLTLSCPAAPIEPRLPKLAIPLRKTSMPVTSIRK